MTVSLGSATFFTFVTSQRGYICEQAGRIWGCAQVTNGTGRAMGVADVLLNLYLGLMIVGSVIYNYFLKHWFNKIGRFEG